MNPKLNYHTNAARLIISAAKEASLLQSIAEALLFFDKTHYDTDGTTAREFCGACTLRDDLVDTFDHHTSLVSNCVVGLYGDGFTLMVPEVEIVPYLYDPTERDDH